MLSIKTEPTELTLESGGAPIKLQLSVGEQPQLRINLTNNEPTINEIPMHQLFKSRELDASLTPYQEQVNNNEFLICSNYKKNAKM